MPIQRECNCDNFSRREGGQTFAQMAPLRRFSQRLLPATGKSGLSVDGESHGHPGHAARLKCAADISAIFDR